MNTTLNTRIVAFFAAAAVTALIGVSQLGLVQHYAGQADAALAQAAAVKLAATAAAASKPALKIGQPG